MVDDGLVLQQLLGVRGREGGRGFRGGRRIPAGVAGLALHARGAPAVRGALHVGDLLRALQVAVDERERGRRRDVVPEAGEGDVHGARDALRREDGVEVRHVRKPAGGTVRRAQALELGLSGPVAAPGSVAVHARHAGHVRGRVVALPVALAATRDHELLPVPLRQRLDPLQVADRAQRAPLPVARLLPLVRLRAHAVAEAGLGDVLEELLHVLRSAAELVAVRVDEHRDAVVRAAGRRELLVLGRPAVAGGDRHAVRRRRRDGDREVARHGLRTGAGDAHGVEAHLLVLAVHRLHLGLQRHGVQLLHAGRPERVVVRRLRRHRDLVRTHPRAALEEHALLPAVVLGNAPPVLRDDVRLEADEARLRALRLQHEAVLRERQRGASLLHEAVIAAAFPVDEVRVRRQSLLHALEHERERHLLARFEEELPARRRAADQRIVPVDRLRQERGERQTCRQADLPHRHHMYLHGKNLVIREHRNRQARDRRRGGGAPPTAHRRRPRSSRPRRPSARSRD